MSASSSAPQKCLRCKAELPAGVTYCVACGCQNESDVHSRRLGALNQADKRVESARGLREMLGSMGAWFRSW